MVRNSPPPSSAPSKAGYLLRRARPDTTRQSVRIQAMDPTALHTWQAPGIRPGSGPAGDAGPSPGDCSGQPQTGSGGWRSHSLQAPIRADVRAGRRQGDRHAPAELEKWQARRPVDRNPAGLCIPEDWPEAGRLDPLGRCHGRPAPDLELQAPDGTVMKWAIAQGYRLDNPAGGGDRGRVAQTWRHSTAPPGAALWRGG